MNIKEVFKRTIILDVILIVLVIFSLMFDSEAITQFNNTYPLSNAISFLLVVYLIAYIINLYFLYTFKKIGKQMYLVLFIIGAILVLVSGSLASNAFTSFLDFFASAITGAILVFLYFTPIKKEFDK